MKFGKRIVLFVAVNVLIIATISILLSAAGIRPYLDAKGIQYGTLIAFCVAWGFGGAFLSLALSRIMAKWMMGVEIVDPRTTDPALSRIVQKVHEYAKAAGIEKMPEVGIYEGEELNAFATGPTKNRSLVAVSTGLLHEMDDDEVNGVLAHEVAHIANGDMVTLTLVQGVVNSFVLFLSRIAGYFASQFVAEERRPMVQLGVGLALEVALGVLGLIVVSAFSRRREFRADLGGASLAGRESMIGALERLKRNYHIEEGEEHPALAAFKISGKSNALMKLFATHPDLDDRIARLKSYRQEFPAGPAGLFRAGRESGAEARQRIVV